MSAVIRFVDGPGVTDLSWLEQVGKGAERHIQLSRPLQHSAAPAYLYINNFQEQIEALRIQ